MKSFLDRLSKNNEEAEEALSLEIASQFEPDESIIFGERGRPSLEDRMKRIKRNQEQALVMPTDNSKTYDPEDPTSLKPDKGAVPQDYSGPKWLVSPVVDPNDVRVDPVPSEEELKRTVIKTEPKVDVIPRGPYGNVIHDPNDEEVDPFDDSGEPDDEEIIDPNDLGEHDLFPVYQDSPLRTIETPKIQQLIRDLARCRKILRANYQKSFDFMVGCIVDRKDAIRAAAFVKPDHFEMLPLSTPDIRELLTAFENKLNQYQVPMPECLDSYRSSL